MEQLRRQCYAQLSADIRNDLNSVIKRLTSAEKVSAVYTGGGGHADKDKMIHKSFNCMDKFL